MVFAPGPLVSSGENPILKHETATSIKKNFYWEREYVLSGPARLSRLLTAATLLHIPNHLSTITANFFNFNAGEIL